MVVAALIFVLCISQNEAAKILALIPTPSISHQVVFRPLTQELARRGHEVIVITTDPAFPKGKTPANLTEIDVHDISYKKWEELYKISSKADNDLIGLMRPTFDIIVNITEMQLKTPEVQTLIKEEKIDLLLLEAWTRPALVLSHVFKVPVIQVASFGFINDNADTVGAAWHPLLYPNTLSQRIYNLSTWEKIETLWQLYRLNNALDSIKDAENAMAKRMFGPEIPSIDELRNNVDMMFLNVHPLWGNNRPVPPNVIYMWGINERPVKELPQELKNYLDSSKNGVIYMSLGTNVKPSQLPPEKVQIFVKVFSQLSYDVLWKWDKDELPGRTENIRIFKWLPQSDVLRHPNIKLFITQGGLQSTDEAIAAGVPLIGIPLLGDQWYNVEQYIRHKIGLKFDINNIREEEFENAIKTVISDPSYRQNVERLRDLMSDEPMKPLERAVWWTEHVLRHGGAKHLRAPAANITWAQYLELELVLTVSLILVAVLSIMFISVFYICRCMCRKVRRNNNTKIKTT